jgi:hypothetical protein
MPKYECSRQVECVVLIEADNDMDLRRQLGAIYGNPDGLVEHADTIVFAENWNIAVDTESKEQRGILVFTDEQIKHAMENAPEPWVED